MNASSLKSIKDELNNLKLNELVELCLRLAKYKKENKELITYLLFNAQDEQNYISTVKKEIENQFKLVNKKNIFYAKKSIRKALRIANKFIRYSGKKATEVEVLIYFCTQLNESGISLERYPVLGNLYKRQLLRIKKSFDALHEDLQYDYRLQLEKLIVEEDSKAARWF